MPAEKIAPGVWIVGGATLSHSSDCSVYLVVNKKGVGALIDTGSGFGNSYRSILHNISSVLKISDDKSLLRFIIATHGHIDHVGSLWRFREEFNSKTIAHERDAQTIEIGDYRKSAAEWYRSKLTPCPVDIKISEPEAIIELDELKLRVIHSPGHTPGSIVVLLQLDDGSKVLFAQDLHGPFQNVWGSNMFKWKKSIQKIRALRADILLEGHRGVFRGHEEIENYIEDLLRAYGFAT